MIIWRWGNPADRQHAVKIPEQHIYQSLTIITPDIYASYSGIGIQYITPKQTQVGWTICTNVAELIIQRLPLLKIDPIIAEVLIMIFMRHPSPLAHIHTGVPYNAKIKLIRTNSRQKKSFYLRATRWRKHYVLHRRGRSEVMVVFIYCHLRYALYSSLNMIHQVNTKEI